MTYGIFFAMSWRRKVNLNEEHIFGGTMTGDQRTNIINSLQSVYERSSNRSIKGMCLRTIEELENTKEVANKA